MFSLNNAVSHKVSLWKYFKFVYRYFTKVVRAYLSILKIWILRYIDVAIYNDRPSTLVSVTRLQIKKNIFWKTEWSMSLTLMLVILLRGPLHRLFTLSNLTQPDRDTGVIVFAQTYIRKSVKTYTVHLSLKILCKHWHSASCESFASTSLFVLKSFHNICISFLLYWQIHI